jgi:hypothetical protein
MSWDLKDSQNIYDELRVISAKILKAIGCHTEPLAINGRGKNRTCSFLHGRFKGILYHYTAGVAEIGTMRWGNHPGWGNKGSSWHVTILDRISDTVVGELWTTIDDELRLLFPVPTVIMADWSRGTWHGNWTCNTTLGVENRNAGYSKLDKVEALGKEPMLINARKWEPYTREQMIANVNLGRLANGWIDGQLDPDWVLTHQCVWATKMDTGPAYPIHRVRDGIFDDANDAIDLPWLAAHPMAPDNDIDFDEEFSWDEEERIEAEEDFVKWIEPTPEIEAESYDPTWVASALYKLGFNTGPEQPTPESLKKQIRWFQRSTSTFRKKNPGRVLAPDGVVGPKTAAFLRERLLQFGVIA